ncbi:4a-hydroxytetrahydrobiopterin dehydratase [Allostreptomyces psammosilenae]|uniref:Putative pterin-4-alpha-carbinolamine dehydratase n=1 Tax=Allostreptomyces psammosilenae TaxID=1892865 RepID=A0A852ZRF1_9ACTN|nr:4a-hydroxytetrahydrobiopterin dehydratase [Allostreptomyces psammosilenae]NYI04057.1 4a-hydroxytetrahydrobiopterin dehydratase [Allostreptomyces psammosilenae]
MRYETVDGDEIERRLAELPGWAFEGDALRRRYRLEHVAAAIMVAHIAQVQKELDHHADLTLGYDSVQVATTTHAVGGRVTATDFALAHRIEEVAKAHGASG